MSEIRVTDLLYSTDSARVDKFKQNVSSKLHVDLEYNEMDSVEWLDIMDETIPALDQILRTPNRFIINEEEVLKVELAKRVTVDSIKHLAQHTNYIQDITEDDEVRPSKILNINKEETYETYENKFIHTLIKNMQLFIELRKQNIELMGTIKNEKTVDYNATSKIGDELIDITLNVKTSVDGSGATQELLERIRQLEDKISDLTRIDTFRVLEKAKFSPVTSPIKRTNLILKNQYFQKATRLWEFIQEHFNNPVIGEEIKKKYDDEGQTKQYFDESFLLDYLITNSITENQVPIDKDKLADKIAEQMVEQMLNANSDMTEEQIKELIGDKFTVVKARKTPSDDDIRKTFQACFDKYLDKVRELKI